ncbi:MAG: peptide ABC transporter substrate-binding protein [Pyrinomonadaceae bacterium]
MSLEQLPTQLRKKGKGNRAVSFFLLISVIFAAVFSACSEIEKPQPETFYAESVPPVKQEFRWSNGKMPKSFDPARAAAAPETDIVRALFEGLTDIDARTLKEIPAAAEKWTGSDDFRVWTFEIRKDARWSNGKRLTANDFVLSWKRLAVLGDKTAHPELFQNIVGLRTSKTTPVGEPTDFVQTPTSSGETETYNEQPNSTPGAKSQESIPSSMPANVASKAKTENKTKTDTKAVKFGVEAIDENTLRITLEMPDKDFPKLVANPIFRPVYDGGEFEKDSLDRDIITNGPFKVANIGKDGITLNRSETYWNKSAVRLEHIQFLPKSNPEAALDAYRKGEIDALTNAEFAPLALKLLAPYEDFRQTTHSALNFYEFNVKNPIFTDRRIREALAISIDRERLTTGELEGSARPAFSFLPLGDKKNAKVKFDIERAKQLFEEAGFANGSGFPKIRLLINRNETQQRVARVVARMWKQNLNLDTEIIVRDLSEMENLRASGEYDLVRRGVVLPTIDEAAGMSAIFGLPEMTDSPPTPPMDVGKNVAQAIKPTPLTGDDEGQIPEKNVIVTEDQAVFEVKAIPLYFPISYSLVKPYVKGFEINGLDAPPLTDISIDSKWQPKTSGNNP